MRRGSGLGSLNALWVLEVERGVNIHQSGLPTLLLSLQGIPGSWLENQHYPEVLITKTNDGGA